MPIAREKTSRWIFMKFLEKIYISLISTRKLAEVKKKLCFLLNARKYYYIYCTTKAYHWYVIVYVIVHKKN